MPKPVIPSFQATLLVSPHRIKTSRPMHSLHQLQPRQKSRHVFFVAGPSFFVSILCVCGCCCGGVLTKIRCMFPIPLSVFVICYDQNTADTQVYQKIYLEKLHLTRLSISIPLWAEDASFILGWTYKN